MIKWYGQTRVPPVSGTVVVKLRGGGEQKGSASTLAWWHDGDDSDIIGYELVDTPAKDAAFDDCHDMALPTALPTDAKARKAIPIYSGFVKYFPDAMIAVAELSRVGNDQHNPGRPLHWDRSKSGDELDALMRHLVEAGTVDTDGVRHSTKLAWRAMANLQKEIEGERK